MVMTLVALMAMTAAMAQDNGKAQKAPKQMTPEEMTTRMAKDLNLTDAQKSKVQALNAEYKDVLGGPGMGRGPRGPRGQRPDGQTGATQQQDKQAKKNDQQEGERPERPQLTDEQKAQMKAHMEKRQEYDGKLKKILTDEQYQSWKKQHQRRGGRGGFPGGKRPDNSQNN